MTTLLYERLQDAFQAFGWTRIPEIPEVLDHHAEEAAKHNISYLEFLDKLLQEEIVAKRERLIRMKTRVAHFRFTKRWINSTSAISRRSTCGRSGCWPRSGSWSIGRI